MPGEPHSELNIAHVLFTDIVGYSRTLVDEQRDLVTQLNQLVRGTEQFRAAETAGKLIRIPTGDGMALAFFTSPDAPVRCAMEISTALKSNPQIQLRMGAHSGPVEAISDVNDRENVAGAGINMAQRVMDCGDAGHILLSRRLADDLAQYTRWRPHLHDLGEVEVKHGVRMGIVNFFTDEVGNPDVPDKVKAKRLQESSPAPSTRTAKTWRTWVLAGAVAGLVCLGAGVWFFSHRSPPVDESGKSIAVLPFENMSSDPQNAAFTDGMQDEVLTNLAQVADLKVISRTSVMEFKTGTKRNLREIGKLLNVAHVLEGSVQREANRVRVTAQLIDARTDAHVWAERYDRPIDDIFAIQTEIAKAIVTKLKARLSPAEKQQLETPSTRDVAAYELFVRGAGLLGTQLEGSEQWQPIYEAIRAFDGATRQDPNFADAWAAAAIGHLRLYEGRADHTPARLALAEKAVEQALRTRPDLGLPHMAAATFFFTNNNQDRGRQELAIAREKLPNNAGAIMLSGLLAADDGRYVQMMADFEKAASLNPLDRTTVQFLADTYQDFRRYDDARRVYEQAAASGQDPHWISRKKASLAWREKADTSLYHEFFQRLSPADFTEGITMTRLEMALSDRDYDEATRVLAADPRAQFEGAGKRIYPRSYFEGTIARARGDQPAAQAAFVTARSLIATSVSQQPDNHSRLMLLAETDAALGRREDAIAEALQAIAIQAKENDPHAAPLMKVSLAQVYAWLGDREQAITELESVWDKPGAIHYGYLKKSADWNDLRGHPRFEKLVASLAPERGASRIIPVERKTSP
jgi:serine/threonine-protein kinase